MKSEVLIEKKYREFLGEKSFPCVGAKAALARNHIKCMVVSDMKSPGQDTDILQFIYDFVDGYRSSNDMYYSAAVIFKEPLHISENDFDELLWQRLSALSALDKKYFQHDPRVASDPLSTSYSFSLKAEAFFIVGLHASSSRKARQFTYPTLVFNPHAEFEKLRASNKFQKMRDVVRQRDIVYSGSVNPMLKDFNEASEVYQYSGRKYPTDWRCPLFK
ncbi:guanitoxin biosynthesis heme-dependent pre-guanitoxin N-hydroxylase GntA [Chryseolinea sp. H1M3-3]|uniref:guanitoxin biosynthesis heme-dependent pre-guanitoxin N-hydroxylase GntA n=1 Tax=Chryseolinea sp. H1M3-3 TaxID=3034144 RepID=UPI0023EB5763|nr:guanitoxin biosynthesis heme-dependent pre-guanitoxin N-hydroxylase GntA [Chryseolinea sp. H1M3-3]